MLWRLALGYSILGCDRRLLLRLTYSIVAACLVELTDRLTVRGKTAPIRWPMKPATRTNIRTGLALMLTVTRHREHIESVVQLH